MGYKIDDRVVVRGLGYGKVTKIGEDGSYHVALDRGGTWSASSAAELIPDRELPIRRKGEPRPDDDTLDEDSGRIGDRVDAQSGAVERLETRIKGLSTRLGTTGQTGMSGQIAELRAKVDRLERGHTPAREEAAKAASLRTDAWWRANVAELLDLNPDEPLPESESLLLRLARRLRKVAPSRSCQPATRKRRR